MTHSMLWLTRSESWAAVDGRYDFPLYFELVVRLRRCLSIMCYDADRSICLDLTMLIWLVNPHSASLCNGEEDRYLPKPMMLFSLTALTIEIF